MVLTGMQVEDIILATVPDAQPELSGAGNRFCMAPECRLDIALPAHRRELIAGQANLLAGVSGVAPRCSWHLWAMFSWTITSYARQNSRPTVPVPS
jgi:hypothetical protein